MQPVAWLGFAVGIGLLLITGSSVIKMLLIPRNLGSAITTVVARSVQWVYRQLTARITDIPRREKILAAGAPTFLFATLVCWIICLYVAYALMLLPFTRDDPTSALRLSGSSLFTLGFATPAGPAPYGIVFAAAISGLGALEVLGPLAVVATSDEATAMARRYIHLSAGQRPAKLFTSIKKAEKWLNAQRPSPLRGDARILVVDDNQGVLREAAELLTSFGYHVIAASNGAEALALLERDQSIDLLFTDVVMPGELAGRALAAKALKMRPSLKVLFVSGYFEGSLVEKEQLETDVQFLAKPYRKKQLAQKIEEVLAAAVA